MNMKKTGDPGLCCGSQRNRQRQRDGQRHYRPGYLYSE